MASRAEPIFGAEDRVSTTELPAELRNETDPKKIAAYYQRREGALRDELRRAAATPPNTRVQIETRTEEEHHPEPASFSVEEASAARVTLIATARQTAKVGKAYWDRLTEDIEKLMGAQPPENQVNSQIWETCYNTLLGMNMDRFIREDRVAAETATRTAAERASQPVTEQTPLPPLPVEVTSKILPGLDLTEEQYRTAQDHIASGKWPLTSENVGGRRTSVGGR